MQLGDDEAHTEVWFFSLNLFWHVSVWDNCWFWACSFHFGLKVYQNLLCIFLPMLLQASNMVSGLCCFTSASLRPALSVALKANNFHLTSHSSVKRITESRPSSVTTDMSLVFKLTWCLCCADPADIPAEDGPSVDQDAARGDQELCAAHGLQSSGSPLSTDPGATGGVTGAA